MSMDRKLGPRLRSRAMAGAPEATRFFKNAVARGTAMQDQVEKPRIRGDRRAFIKHGGQAAAGAAIGVGLLAKGSSAFAQGGGVTKGDIAILTFLATIETIE